MVPKEFRKSLCIIAGWITLLEAIAWVAASIYSLGVYGCYWEFIGLQKGVSTWTMLYVTYFMGGCKGEAGAQQLGYSLIPPTDPASRMQVWMWIYTIVSVVWFITCILLIIVATGEVRGRKGGRLYYPWIGLTATLVVLDLASAVFHFIDVLNTASPDKYAQFCGSTNWSTLTMGLSNAGVTTWLPSLYVTLFFCRLVIFWVLNICFVVGVYKASDAVSLYKTKYIQTTLMTAEKQTSWKDQFYQGPDPSIFEHQPKNITSNYELDKTDEPRPITPVTMQQKSQPARYKMDEFGIPIEELNMSDPRESSNNPTKSNLSTSPYLTTGQVFDYTGRPVGPESYNSQWQNNAPPIASGVQVPPELNKFEPFSYMAGDQPQLKKRPVSRSNSKSEYPPIPRPDYTIANRRPVSLEYVPNRFKVPSPVRPAQSQNSTGPQSPISPKKVAPIPPSKPQIYPRSNPPIPEDPGMAPQVRYISQQAIPSQQQAYYTRQTSQNNNYNINKLY